MAETAIVIGVGAGAGLGAALCRRFAREGLHVFPSGRTLAKLEAVGSGRARIRFEEPVRAVSPGQAAVFYDAERDEAVLGGGWIVEGRR